MPDYFKPVRAGDKFDVKAPAWNAMLDAARAHQNRQRRGGAPGEYQVIEPDVVDVYNASGSDVGPMSVLGVDTILVSPTTDKQQFLAIPCLRCIVPTADHAGKFVVTVNRIAAGAIGRAIILGATCVQIAMQAEGDQYADVFPGDVSKLKSTSNGAARILFADSGTGVKWAFVRIGGGGGAPLSVGTLQGQVYTMLTDNVAGWSVIKATSYMV